LPALASQCPADVGGPPELLVTSGPWNASVTKDRCCQPANCFAPLGELWKLHGVSMVAGEKKKTQRQQFTQPAPVLALRLGLAVKPPSIYVGELAVFLGDPQGAKAGTTMPNVRAV